MKKINLNLNQIKTMTSDMIKNKIYEWDKNQWYQGMNNKFTLEMYRNNKNTICQVNWMKNGVRYSTMMKARSDSLDLEWRVQNTNTGKLCKLCLLENETLEHFLLTCTKLQDFRKQFIHLQWPLNLDKGKIMQIILLFVKDKDFNDEYFINMIQYLWNKRQILMKDVINN